jgi:hypothetical protein
MGFMCHKGRNPRRGFSRGHFMCTYYAGIGIVDLGKTLEKSQSLKEDKTWLQAPRRLDCRNPIVTDKWQKGCI